MTLSIKNGRYAFWIKLDLMLSMSLWKDFQLLQILNDLSTKHLIILILCENDVKLAKFNRKPVYSAEPRVYLGIPFTRVTVNLDD